MRRYSKQVTVAVGDFVTDFGDQLDQSQGYDVTGWFVRVQGRC